MNLLRHILASLFLLSSAAAWSQEVECTQADRAKIESILHKAATEAGNENRMIYFGKQFLGIPYVAHTLEEGNKEHLIVNVHGLDCTTFVETVFALYLCDKEDRRTFDDFCRNLTKIRFRNGKMTDYTSRLHYFTWWGEDNEQLGLVRQVVRDGAPFSAIQTVNINYMSAHPEYYKQLKLHPEFIPVIRSQEQETNGRMFRYIPKSRLNGSPKELADVHTGDIISIITNKDGLDTSHVGIVFWQNGKLHLMHASSLYKKVVMDQKTFYNYSQGQKSHLGIRVYRPN